MLLMNGKEVNHLLLNGEQFDLSNYGKKVKVVKRIEVCINGVNFDGSYFYNNTGGASIISAGTLGYIIGLTYGQCYYIFNTASKNPVGVWVPKDSVEILENGGVNKPFYLLFIYKLDDVREVTPSWL